MIRPISFRRNSHRGAAGEMQRRLATALAAVRSTVTAGLVSPSSVSHPNVIQTLSQELPSSSVFGCSVADRHGARKNGPDTAHTPAPPAAGTPAARADPFFRPPVGVPQMYGQNADRCGGTERRGRRSDSFCRTWWETPSVSCPQATTSETRRGWKGDPEILLLAGRRPRYDICCSYWRPNNACHTSISGTRCGWVAGHPGASKQSHSCGALIFDS